MTLDAPSPAIISIVDVPELTVVPAETPNQSLVIVIVPERIYNVVAQH